MWNDVKIEGEKRERNRNEWIWISLNENKSFMIVITMFKHIELSDISIVINGENGEWWNSITFVKFNPFYVQIFYIYIVENQ